jgi:hypothetical protein
VLSCEIKITTILNILWIGLYLSRVLNFIGLIESHECSNSFRNQVNWDLNNCSNSAHQIPCRDPIDYSFG